MNQGRIIIITGVPGTCSTYKIKILSVSGGHLRKDYYLTYNRNKFLNPTLEAVIKVLDTLHGGEEAD